MHDLLFLAHRIPYPPDKGEKIRAWHEFQMLAQTHRIHLGCFVDDPADLVHVPTLAAHCADLAAFSLYPRHQRLRALLRLRPGSPLSLGYFADRRMTTWVMAKRASGIDRAFVYCSAMAPYVMAMADLYRVLDMVDVDSAKWAEYAANSQWPLRAVWAREARTLLAFERRAAVGFDQTLFVSESERAEFVSRAPEAAGRCVAVENGVDAVKFAPSQGGASPYSCIGPVAVFTGTMDYRPNIDAAVWFALKVLPRLREIRHDFHFAVVGAKPAPAVRQLTSHPGVIVTGRVDDVRPYLAHAAVAVAPLRMARGIQNKVLEAMAMGRPVVASPQAFAGLRVTPGHDLLVADGEAAFAASVAAVLDGDHPGLGAAGRVAVLQRYAWSATLAGLTAAVTPPGAAGRDGMDKILR